MSRKDYRKIASVMASFMEDIEQDEQRYFDNQEAGPVARAYHTDTVSRLANMLQDDNPRFDRITFLKACGVKV